MPVLFYISSTIAVLATIMVITRYHPIHALLYLVISFMAMAVLFISIGAPFVAALEVIIYAGAIIVLLIFVVMMMNIGNQTALQEKQWLQPKMWVGPSIFATVLLGETIALLLKGNKAAIPLPAIDIRKVSMSLFREYIIAVELTGFLLMAGIVGAAHIGKHRKKHLHRFLQAEPSSQPTLQPREGVTVISKEREETKQPIAPINKDPGI